MHPLHGESSAAGILNVGIEVSLASPPFEPAPSRLDKKSGAHQTLPRISSPSMSHIFIYISYFKLLLVSEMGTREDCFQKSNLPSKQLFSNGGSTFHLFLASHLSKPEWPVSFPSIRHKIFSQNGLKPHKKICLRFADYLIAF